MQGPFFYAVILVSSGGSLCWGAQSATSTTTTATPASEIIQKMVDENKIRAEHLKYFTSLRHYHLDFHGLGRNLSADMHVKATYAANTGKTFQVLDESGSRFLLNHVLRKLLQTEQDDSRRPQAELLPANYTFSFETETTDHGRDVYVFAVEPRVKNKVAYRGKIWIDAQDDAVIRLEAQPAENPSFWIRSTEIRHVYAKNGEFWLPQTNRSESKVRMGGVAVLTIDYGTYKFEEPHELTPAGTNEVTSHAR